MAGRGGAGEVDVGVAGCGGAAEVDVGVAGREGGDAGDGKSGVACGKREAGAGEPEKRGASFGEADVGSGSAWVHAGAKMQGSMRGPMRTTGPARQQSRRGDPSSRACCAASLKESSASLSAQAMMSAGRRDGRRESESRCIPCRSSSIRVAVARWPSPQTRTCRTTWASVPIQVRGVVWRRMRDMLLPAPVQETSQNCRFYAILLCGPDAQASGGQVDFDEKRDVSARDENHRADEQ